MFLFRIISPLKAMQIENKLSHKEAPINYNTELSTVAAATAITNGAVSSMPEDIFSFAYHISQSQVNEELSRYVLALNYYYSPSQMRSFDRSIASSFNITRHYCRKLKCFPITALQICRFSDDIGLVRRT